MASANENWINEVLASPQGMERAKAPDHLSAKIQQKIANYNKIQLQFTKTQINWLVAASLLLVSFNGMAIYLHQQKKQAAVNFQNNEYSFVSNDLIKL